MKQETLFRLVDATGNLKPNVDPFAHQSSRSKAQSAIAERDFKSKGYHITQKLRIKAFMFANQRSTVPEISIGTGIPQHGRVTARFDDLRHDGYDLIDNHGRWSIKRRIEK